MRGLSVFLLRSFLCLLVSHPGDAARANEDGDGIYIVYMGTVSLGKSASGIEPTELLKSIQRKDNAVVHSYWRSFSGFAAHLSMKEARLIAQKPGVVSVFPDRLLQLHTTRSWDFLNYQTDLLIDSRPTSNSDSPPSQESSDTIIGLLDSGIWPEADSFRDEGMGPVPSRWKGVCMAGDSFSSSNCNRKLIGARFYKSDFSTADAVDQSPRDRLGHGTHVASTAAGKPVSGTSYYGIAAGTAKGGSPGSRIAAYRVCLTTGCRSSAILAAFDDAIADGVDVLSVSLGASASSGLDLRADPIAIGAFHAAQHGILVVCSAGNDGPNPGSVVNAAPWILTVAASTIDRDFESDVVLEGNKVIKGEAINFSPLDKTPVYTLIDGKSAKKRDADALMARNCNPNTMDELMVKGSIVLCYNDDGGYREKNKMEEVKSLGGIGMISVNDEGRSAASIYKSLPVTVVTSDDAAKILAYINLNSTRTSVGTILVTTTVENYKPAPVMAYFSSRGPSSLTRNILKPDVTAPGVDILAAWIGNDTKGTPGKGTPAFSVLSGTSMSCPHVSGIAAVVKSRNPSWDPSAIRSAIMTTATQTNNLKSPITTHTGSVAAAYEYGSGQVNPAVSLNPGLVYETNASDYLNFLCYYGYSITDIKTIAGNASDGFSCPADSNADLISNMNYPSIAVSGFDGKGSRTITRTLTNVAGNQETPYAVSIDAPKGLAVKVIPEKLVFGRDGEKQSYLVLFSASSPVKDDLLGSLTWSNGKYSVRSPFVVSSSKH
ncbi:CO(2)-response secreted protease-like [Punica granatum]|uniref:Uncharacterized protein n=2 Tax=Punica granatum TaxID=22663 RepID=A0A2I0L391_PUNGR|nr:CO(2)-response secreted protease-like [Punica granatum]PKI75168.1 hypothetical protein CRG98_004503 [Punica granatum]